MPLYIIENDITKMKVDAIVNAANPTLLGGGGVDGAIHRAAGPTLLQECKKLNGCKTGQAKITKAGKLKAHFVIHTVGPIWQGGNFGEKEALISCYNASLQLAKENNCTSIAFPLISAGVYGYPKEDAVKIAIDTISSFLCDNEMDVSLVIFNKNEIFKSTINKYNEIFSSIKEADFIYDCAFLSAINLDEMLQELDESFSQMLFRMIREKGISEVECYKNANIDRKLFSKIRSNDNYHPKKETAIAFAISLHLNLKETEELLRKAGFALSHSNKADIIVEYFIKNKNYNIFEINSTLFAFDQKLLGA